MNEPTASDLLHLPHIVLLKRSGTPSLRVVNFENGEEAHSYAQSCAVEGAYDTITVAARIRQLSRAFKDEQA